MELEIEYGIPRSHLCRQVGKILLQFSIKIEHFHTILKKAITYLFETFSLFIYLFTIFRAVRELKKADLNKNGKIGGRCIGNP